MPRVCASTWEARWCSTRLRSSGSWTGPSARSATVRRTPVRAVACLLTRGVGAHHVAGVLVLARTILPETGKSVLNGMHATCLPEVRPLLCSCRWRGCVVWRCYAGERSHDARVAATSSWSRPRTSPRAAVEGGTTEPTSARCRTRLWKRWGDEDPSSAAPLPSHGTAGGVVCAISVPGLHDGSCLDALCACLQQWYPVGQQPRVRG